MTKNKKRLIVISSPSGGGKSTVARHLLKKYKMLRFSISATTRKRRPKETYGIEYFFLSKDQFKEKIRKDEFVEYEEIFGNYYGTPRSEVDKALICDECLLFDIDVKGAISLQKAYPNDTLLIFLIPPSINELERRLRKRSTESDKQINKRLERVKIELEQQEQFDRVIININLEHTFQQIEEIIGQHI